MKKRIFSFSALLAFIFLTNSAFAWLPKKKYSEEFSVNALVIARFVGIEEKKMILGAAIKDRHLKFKVCDVLREPIYGPGGESFVRDNLLLSDDVQGKTLSPDSLYVIGFSFNEKTSAYSINDESKTLSLYHANGFLYSKLNEQYQTINYKGKCYGNSK